MREGAAARAPWIQPSQRRGFPEKLVHGGCSRCLDVGDDNDKRNSTEMAILNRHGFITEWKISSKIETSVAFRYRRVLCDYQIW